MWLLHQNQDSIDLSIEGRKRDDEMFCRKEFPISSSGTKNTAVNPSASLSQGLPAYTSLFSPFDAYDRRL